MSNGGYPDPFRHPPPPFSYRYVYNPTINSIIVLKIKFGFLLFCFVFLSPKKNIYMENIISKYFLPSLFLLSIWYLNKITKKVSQHERT